MSLLVFMENPKPRRASMSQMTKAILFFGAVGQKGCAAFVRGPSSLTNAPSFTRGLGSQKSLRRPTLMMSISTTSEELKCDVISKSLKDGLKTYEPSNFEGDIYSWWERTGCFEPDSKTGQDGRTKADPYVIPMPPPNVTGKLHMGHAIFVALQDVLARFHRMRGRPVLWLPGTDHAGIATQLQVEKQLQAEGTSREIIGREKFMDRVWAYKEEQGGHITRQLRILGASADWSRERFTMDNDLSEAVVEAFVRLYDKGLIYRGEYMVNWAPLLKTAVSDLEVDYTEEEGHLYYFKYAVSGSEDFVPVATSRPETILGDTALCVHPDDARYNHLIGSEAVVPMSGGRVIPIIGDDYVDREFGTGALKITPGHDPNDYAISKRHDLPIINIMNKDGTLNHNAGKYENLDRFEARERLWADMEAADLVLKVESHRQRVPRSQRGGEIIEPLISSQWFVKTRGMADKALQAVEKHEIKILPDRFEKIWHNWLDDIHDWCVSRQLWWGHRIPVWYIGEDAKDFVVARNVVEARSKAREMGFENGVSLRQEDDVLDTWFSSGLWPFATVGWPQSEGEPDSELDRFYPATCLETGYDILFFWVARMVMLGIELTEKSPFSVVYLHGLVRASDGSKMSKTKGNVIDPVETVSAYGADSLRYSLVTGVTPGQDIPLNMEKVEANKNFANKLWNTCKFVSENALRDLSSSEKLEIAVRGPMSEAEFAKLLLPEQYIVSKLHHLVDEVTHDVENYQIGAAGGKIYEFIWDHFADWYIEVSKTRLYAGVGGQSKDDATQSRRVLVYVLDACLRLLHPFMPFVSEKLWQHLPRAEAVSPTVPNSIMLADWPKMDDADPLVASEDAVEFFECFQALTRSIRNARAEYNVEPGKRINAMILAPASLAHKLEHERRSLIALAKLDPDQTTIVESGHAAFHTTDSVRLVVQDGIEAYLPLADLVDPVKERQRLEKQLQKTEKEIEKLSYRLESEGFTSKAPKAVVERARQEHDNLSAQAEKIRKSLDKLSLS